MLERVCGRGKTELVFEVIAQQLRKGRKVGFTIARRQVVLEIAGRLQKSFPDLKVVPVCQGHTTDIYGDITVCTTHQLFRFPHYFDLLIIDEPDAFPFKNDEVLQSLAANSCRGNTVYLTATPDSELKNRAAEGELEHLYLARRPHGHDLCVPQVCYGNRVELLIRGLKWLKRQLNSSRKVMIFVSSMKKGRMIYQLLRTFVSCCYVSSKTENRDNIINDFRNGRYQIIVTTLILERGITIDNVQVLVWQRENRVFDEASLTQISGRVGRSFDNPEGECLFLCEGRSESVDDCIRSIIRANSYGL
ncbi:MAG: hypothetical protein IKE93_03205 [Erysipelotrichaceae bacterium]|nr:hypothetical protein [Erysipelotrichaceae bacterium]